MIELFRITSLAKWLQAVIQRDRFSYLTLTQMIESFESRVVQSDYKRWSRGIDFPIWPSHKWWNRFESRVVPSDYKMAIPRDRFSYLILTQMMESFRITSLAKWLQDGDPEG